MSSWEEDLRFPQIWRPSYDTLHMDGLHQWNHKILMYHFSPPMNASIFSFHCLKQMLRDVVVHLWVGE